MRAFSDIRPADAKLPPMVLFQDLAALEIKSLEPNGFTVSAPPGTFDPDMVYSVEMPVVGGDGEGASCSRAILSCESARSQVASFFILTDELF